jgi:hypothetical protein
MLSIAALTPLLENIIENQMVERMAGGAKPHPDASFYATYLSVGE